METVAAVLIVLAGIVAPISGLLWTAVMLAGYACGLILLYVVLMMGAYYGARSTHYILRLVRAFFATVIRELCSVPGAILYNAEQGWRDGGPRRD